jgi:DNA-directed RNA polymerase subunit N (RpoN/RPB10)
MLAVLAEIKLCVQFWLRPGNAHCSNNLINFTLELLGQLPHHLHLRLVRADSGFYDDRWLSLLEERGLPYIVVTDLSVRVKSLLRKTTRWEPTKVAGLEVAEELYESKYASRPRRLILLRRRIDAPGRGGGKLLLDCPGYQYQVLVTSLPESFTPLQVWYEYNGRANIENVIKELKDGFGLGGFCCQRFYATEAALSLAVMTYNWTVLFARHLGWLEKMTIQTLRFRLFRSAGIISYGQGRTTIRLGIPPEFRTWWAEVWEKILSPFPNCNAVAQHP